MPSEGYSVLLIYTLSWISVIFISLVNIKRHMYNSELKSLVLCNPISAALQPLYIWWRKTLHGSIPLVGQKCYIWNEILLIQKSCKEIQIFFQKSTKCCFMILCSAYTKTFKALFLRYVQFFHLFKLNHCCSLHNFYVRWEKSRHELYYHK